MKWITMAVAGFVAPLAGQTYDTVLEAATELRMEATQGLLTTWESVPAGRQIHGTLVLNRAVTTWLWAQAKAAATFTHVLDPVGGKATVSVEERADIQATMISFPSIAKCGQQAVRFIITPRDGRTVTGAITVRAGFTTLEEMHWLTTFVATSQVDIGEDGSIESTYVGWHAPAVSPVFRVTVPPSGLPVLVTTYLLLSSDYVSETAHRYVTVEFVPDPGPVATFTGYGAGCGPGLWGAESYASARQFAYGVYSAPKSAAGALSFGVQRIQVVLPGGCTALTEPLALVPMNTDPNGGARLVFPVPSGLLGVVNAQFLGLEGATLRTSEGLEMSSSLWP